MWKKPSLIVDLIQKELSLSKTDQLPQLMMEKVGRRILDKRLKELEVVFIRRYKGGLRADRLEHWGNEGGFGDNYKISYNGLESIICSTKTPRDIPWDTQWQLTELGKLVCDWEANVVVMSLSRPEEYIKHTVTKKKLTLVLYAICVDSKDETK